jgi:hypothetical protein
MAFLKEGKSNFTVLSLFPSAVLTASGSKGIISVRIMDTPKVDVKLKERFENNKIFF